MDPNEPVQTPATAAGWYPVDATTQRYWDGFEWTDQVAPLAPAASAPGTAAMPVPTSDQRTYVLIMHLGGLFVGFLVPLIMWLIKKDESPFIDHHGKQSMNFNLTMLIAAIVSVVLILVLVGILMLLALAIAYFVLSILAAVAANKGEYYRFPFTIQFFT